MTLIKVYNWDKYYLFTLDLPDPFPKGTEFPYKGKQYRVIDHGYEPINRREESEDLKIVDLVLIVDSIGN